MATQSDREIVARVRALLHETFEGTADAVRGSGHAARLARQLVRQRDRLGHARNVLQTVPNHEAIMREAQIGYMLRMDEFSHVPNRSELVRAWTAVLIEAAEKVESDRRDQALYAVVAANPTDEDREWGAAATRVAGQHWDDQQS
jgi:hypothetical protein